MITPFKEET